MKQLTQYDWYPHRNRHLALIGPAVSLHFKWVWHLFCEWNSGPVMIHLTPRNFQTSAWKFWLNGWHPMCCFRSGKKFQATPTEQDLDEHPSPFYKEIPLLSAHPTNSIHTTCPLPHPCSVTFLMLFFFFNKMCQTFLYCMKTTLYSLGLILVCILYLVYHLHLVPCLQMWNCRAGTKCCCLATLVKASLSIGYHDNCSFPLTASSSVCLSSIHILNM